MKLLSILMCSALTFSSMASMKPGEGLKSPKEVLEAIELFKKEQDKKDSDLSCRMVNDREGCIQDMEKARELLIEALFASHMCSIAINSNIAMDTWVNEGQKGDVPEEAYDISEYINENLSWSRDPMRYANFKGSCPEKRAQEYSDIMKEENNRIFHDALFGCKSYQKQLNQDILDLHGYYMYRKIYLKP